MSLIVTFELYQFWVFVYFDSISSQTIRKFLGFLMISVGTEWKYWVEKVYVTITFCITYFFLYCIYLKVIKYSKFTVFSFFFSSSHGQNQCYILTDKDWNRDLQSVSQYFETFRCFTEFFFYHKWKDGRLLLINIVFTSCLMSCRTTYDLGSKKLGNIRKLSKLHRMIAQCPVPLPKWKFC